jgi:hypothetical protein
VAVWKRVYLAARARFLAASFEGARHPPPCRAARVAEPGVQAGVVQPVGIDSARDLRPATDAAMSPTLSSARLFLCARCHVQVLLCRQCDRGQQYCGRECSGQARHERRREAAQRYQRSPRGRQLHAERSQRWRARQQVAAVPLADVPENEDAGTVTHQGDFEAQVDAPASAATVPAVAAPIRWCCNCCRQPLTPYVRLGFLRRPRGRDRPS